MSEMVEKVARAMWDVWRASRIALEWAPDVDWLQLTEQAAKGHRAARDIRDAALAEARAAIAALREPTDGMLDAAAETGTYGGISDCGAAEPDDFDPETVWQAMIDAALKETDDGREDR